VPVAVSAACRTPAETTSGTTGPKYGSFGFDVAGMNRAVPAGDDFNEYANGTWLKKTEIPADRAVYDTFTLLAELAETRTRRIIDEASASTAASGDLKKVGDYYAAFMDEAGIEAKGNAVQPELDAIAAIPDKSGLARALGDTLRADVDLLNATNFYTNRLFGLWVSQDMDEPAKTSPYLVQGGLGLPDRDFYLDPGKRFVDLREKYQAHIARILALAAAPDADAKAARIIALETAIARVHATQVDTNDVRKGNNHWTRQDFPAKAPGLDWNAYFDRAGLGAQQTFVVWQPAAIAGISHLVETAPLEDWKAYLAFHALDRASGLMPRAFADEAFVFYGQTLNGTPKQQERWKRAVSAVDNALGEAVGRIYAERFFPPAAKARADAMVKDLVTAFGQRIDRLEWMSAATKAAARRKLAGLAVGVGYPERWRDYSALEIRRDDALGNARRAGLFEYRRNLAKLGRPVDRSEWFLLPQEINALNLPLENRLIFPAAILEPPFFDLHADAAVNYGAIGGIIGHEISHSFDSTGALFDETGRLRNWWTPADLARFEQSSKALAAQYDEYRPFSDLGLNGALTLGENIADVAGLATAYDAYRLSLNGKEPPALEGFTADQRFFLGWAQNYRTRYREPVLRNLIMTDVHAPGPYRAATVRNVDRWYDSFAVMPGQKLFLPPDKRVKVW
jgi:putative endopeptidase